MVQRRASLFVMQLYGQQNVTATLKGALKAHIHISLYESNTLQEQDAALLFLSVIQWGEIFVYYLHPFSPLAAAILFNWVAEITSCPLSSVLIYAPLSSFAIQHHWLQQGVMTQIDNGGGLGSDEVLFTNCNFRFLVVWSSRASLFMTDVELCSWTFI